MFVIGYSSSNTPSDVILLGTAFAVSNILVVTACHVICEDNSSVLLSNYFFISSTVIKNGEINEMINPRQISPLFFDEVADWAILKLTTHSTQFLRWLTICPVDSLPNVPANHEELKCYYAPFGQYLTNSFDSMTIWSDNYKQVLQYNADRTKIYCDGGLYRGSCGSPYINHDGHVVALHLASMNESVNYSNVKYKKRKTIDEFEKRVSESLTDMSNVHASIREGLVLRSISTLMVHLEQ